MKTETIPISIDADNVMRVSHTRVTLDTVVMAFQDGLTAEEIAQQYPVLNLADVYSVIGYYLRHTDEVSEYLNRRNTDIRAVKSEVESRFDPNGIRARLSQRRINGED